MNPPGFAPYNSPVVKRFNAFSGVFVPTFLTIIGVILFLRTGWVVGQAGFLGALAIVLVANSITLATSFSLSSIATSMKVGTGGAYYLVSRSLGLEAGAAVGLPLYLSQTLSLTFYVVGFSEVIASVFPWINGFYLSTAVIGLLALLSFVGADWAIRSQYIILGLIILGLLSFFLGSWSWEVSPQMMATDNLAPVFAVFFPAVTGIMAGVSMSGDLKDPGKQIPKGTFWAVGVTLLIYIVVPVFLAFNVPQSTLLTENEIMIRVSRVPLLVVLGVVGAALSSAIGSVVAAPRTLQALARDRVVPSFLGRGSGPAAEPRIATLVTYVLAQAALFLGGLNLIAEVLTMFFLITYGTLNLAAFVETVMKSPGFRPSFRTHPAVSLYGAAGCVVAMFLINPLAALAASGAVFLVYLYTQKRGLETTWGDVKAGVWFSMARSALFRIGKKEPHPRNWRPNLLLHTGTVKPSRGLMNLVRWLGHGEGITVVAYPMARGPKDTAYGALSSLRGTRGLEGIIPLVYTDHEGARATLLETVGLGGLRPNTLLMDWRDLRFPENLDMVRDALDMGMSFMGFREGDDGLSGGRRIDMWWRGLAQSGHLMLLVSHLLLQNEEWRDARAFIRMIVRSPAAKKRAGDYLQQVIAEARVKAISEIIVSESSPPGPVIQEISRGANLVILGSRLPEKTQREEYLGRMEGLLSGLGNVLVLRSAGKERIIDMEQ